MVVCHKDWWVNRKNLHKQKSKQLVFYFLFQFLICLHIDYKCLLNFCRIPQDKSSLRFTSIRKNGEKSEGLNPFWNRLKVEVFLGQFGQHLPFTCVKPVTNQQALSAGNHRKTQRNYQKNLVPKNH